LKYTDKNDKEFQWGYAVDNIETAKIVGVKLLLDPDGRQYFNTASALMTKRELTKWGKEPWKVVSDFMEAIITHAMKIIAKQYSQTYLDTVNKEFVVSVPAIWSDKAKDATLRVCSKFYLNFLKT
jgi:hypothetical protein